MTFDWEHYRYLALQLYGVEGSPTPNEEARFRAAISRAYYSSLLRMRDRLIAERKLDPRETNVHKVIPEILKRDGRDERKRIGNQLERMKRYRKSADYDNEFPDVHRSVRTVLDMAQKISESL